MAAPWTRFTGNSAPTPPPPPPSGAVTYMMPVVPAQPEEQHYRYPEPAEGPAERMERLAASGYPGATTDEEETLVRNWVFTGVVNGHKRVSFRAARPRD